MHFIFFFLEEVSTFFLFVAKTNSFKTKIENKKTDNFNDVDDNLIIKFNLFYQNFPKKRTWHHTSATFNVFFHTMDA